VQVVTAGSQTRAGSLAAGAIALLDVRLTPDLVQVDRPLWNRYTAPAAMPRSDGSFVSNPLPPPYSFGTILTRSREDQQSACVVPEYSRHRGRFS
jgi:hypothetical protein